MSSLCSISASCRQLYILTVPVLYQRINLNNKNHGCPGLLLRLTTKGTKLPNFIRQITIESGNWINDLALQQLIELFSKLTQLETLTWSQTYDIPDGILQSLHKYPFHRIKACQGVTGHVHLKRGGSSTLSATRRRVFLILSSTSRLVHSTVAPYV
jgi:hypothetical protein